MTHRRHRKASRSRSPAALVGASYRGVSSVSSENSAAVAQVLDLISSDFTSVKKENSRAIPYIFIQFPVEERSSVSNRVGTVSNLICFTFLPGDMIITRQTLSSLRTRTLIGEELAAHRADGREVPGQLRHLHQGAHRGAVQQEQRCGGHEHWLQEKQDPLPRLRVPLTSSSSLSSSRWRGRYGSGRSGETTGRALFARLVCVPIGFVGLRSS